MQETKVSPESQLERLTPSENSYIGICKETTGKLVDPEQWSKGQNFRRKLHEQSLAIADKLESVGFDAYEDRDLTLVGLCSEQAIEITSFRQVRFIPEVARRKRKTLFKDVEFYASTRPKLRTWTMTGGPRIGFDGLGDRIHTMHRMVSKLNDQPFMKDAGVQVLFRATELGTIKREISKRVRIKGSVEVPTFHPHCHLLIELERYLDPVDWEVLLAKVSRFWGTSHWKDCGVLRDTRELVKYCAKPDDLQELSGLELLTLQNILTRVRHYECLGGLRKERAERKKRKQRVDLVNGRWRVSNNWNQDSTPKAETEDDEDTIPPPLYLLDRDAKKKTLVAEDELGQQDQPPAEGSTSGAPPPLILARCVPAPIFSPTLEPCFLVEGLGDRDPLEIIQTPQAQWVLSQIGWQDDSISVHNASLTVPENQPNEVQKSPEKVPKIHELLSPI